MKNIQIKSLCVVPVLVLFFLSGCETKDQNKFAGAQQCFDKLKDTAADAEAQACLDKIAGITTPDAYVLRCSIDFFLGGVKAAQMIAAYDQYNNAADKDKAALLMTGLAQTDKTLAQTTYNDCDKSQSPGLKFIATSSLAGTIIKVDGTAAGGTDVATYLSHCENGGAGGVCDDTAIGTAVVALYGTYCTGDQTADRVCTEIRSAIDAAASSTPADIAIALYNLIAN